MQQPVTRALMPPITVFTFVPYFITFIVKVSLFDL
jgi:hypothetical protein